MRWRMKMQKERDIKLMNLNMMIRKTWLIKGCHHMCITIDSKQQIKKQHLKIREF